MNPDAPLTPHEELEIRITALLMGQLPPDEAAALEAQIAADPELAKLRAHLSRAVELLREARRLPESAAGPLQLSKERRDALLAKFRGIKAVPSPQPVREQQQKKNAYWKWVVRAGIAASITVGASWLLFPPILAKRSQATAVQGELRMIDEDLSRLAGEPAAAAGSSGKDALAGGWASQPGAVRSSDLQIIREYNPSNAIELPVVPGESGIAAAAPARQGSNVYLPQVTAERGEYQRFPNNAPVGGDTSIVSNTNLFAQRDEPAAPSKPIPNGLVKAGNGTLSFNGTLRSDSTAEVFVRPAQPTSFEMAKANTITSVLPNESGIKAPEQKNLADLAEAAPTPKPAEPYAKSEPFNTAGKALLGSGQNVPSKSEPPMLAEAYSRLTDSNSLKSAPKPVVSFGGAAQPARPPQATLALEELSSTRENAKAKQEGEVRDRVGGDYAKNKVAQDADEKPAAGTEIADAPPADPAFFFRSENGRDGKKAVIVSGQGVTVLSGANTYTGSTTSNGGVLSIPALPTARPVDAATLNLGPVAQTGPSGGTMNFDDARRKGLVSEEAQVPVERELEGRKSNAPNEEQSNELGINDLAGVSAEKSLNQGGYNKAAESRWREVSGPQSEFKEVDNDSARVFAIRGASKESQQPYRSFGKKSDQADVVDRKDGTEAAASLGTNTASENWFWDGQATKGREEVLAGGGLQIAQSKGASSAAAAPEDAEFEGFINYGSPVQIKGNAATGIVGGSLMKRSFSQNPESLKGTKGAEGDKDSLQRLEELNFSIEANGKPAEPKGERVDGLAAMKLPVLGKLSRVGADIVSEAKPSSVPLPVVPEMKKQLAEAEPPAPPQKSEPPVPQPEVSTKDNAFSTFSLNVSDVSFKLAGASLEKGAMPEVASVRTEEFINALDYRDPQPGAGAPLAFAAERARYPFAHNRDLLRLSVKTAAAGREPGRPLNLVLLLDNSGSMERADRVRILKESLSVLTKQLKPQDKLSIITFSRTPRLWADGVSGEKAGEFAERVAGITPEGGTDLSAAMDLGYKTALKHYAVGSVNRVVLLTDGAANLGDVQPAALKAKVETHRKQGVAFDCFGVGWEGYNDDLLEQLSRNGDGRYGFINSPEAASTEFAAQLAGALRVAASDVKVQVEFNPRRVTSYRQLGYAKHQLKKEQFRDNTVDAAEIGAAESGNALYAIEVNPGGIGDIATVRVRFKVPGTSDYREHEWAVPFNAPAPAIEQSSTSLRLAATAGAFAEMLAQSQFAAEVSTDKLLAMINGIPAIYGADPRPAKLEWMIRQAKNILGK